MNLFQVEGNTWCLEEKQAIGIYKTDESHCILIDSGIVYLRDKIENALAAAGLTPCGLIITHSHFDHTGNTAYFQKKYNIPVAMAIGEAETCRTFAAIKGYLFTFPAGQVMDDDKLASCVCRADVLIEEDQNSLDFCGTHFEILHTPGHSIDHISIVTPDNVCHVGDALVAGHALAVEKLPYAYNIQQYIESCEAFFSTNFDALIIPHGGVWGFPYKRLVEDNIDLTQQQFAKVSSLIDRPMSTDEICRAVRQGMEINVSTPEKAQSLERFLRPYIECMLDENILQMDVSSGDLRLCPTGEKHNIGDKKRSILK